MKAGPIRRSLAASSLVIGCTLLYGMRELLALQRLRWRGKRRPPAH
jgi:hypothetical protein